MKSFLFTTVAATAITAAGVAGAADMTMATRAPPPGGLGPAPVFSWTGCYLGANAGLGAGHTQFQDAGPDGFIDISDFNRSAHTDSSGGVFGGQLGCDWQATPNWVLGLQGTFNGTDISGTNPDQFNALNAPTLSSTLDWYATITGRLGWSLNNVLLYGKGGAAWAHEKLEVDSTNGSASFAGSTSITRLGWTVGTGVEWAFAPSWSAFAEADYFGFGDSTSTVFGFGPANLTAFPINTKLQFETFTVGVNYRFRGW
jgi:outer membrane immunogenic protein